jgi:hypothetical protein
MINDDAIISVAKLASRIWMRNPYFLVFMIKMPPKMMGALVPSNG